ncbi:Topoisomerase 1-associated factor 1, partial [Quaeritorhiza haematococci]
MDPDFEAHLLSVCTAIGGYDSSSTTDEQKKYVPGDEVLDCLKDLKRFLRKEDGDKKRPVFQALGRWGVARGHLIPLLLQADPEKDVRLISLVENIPSQQQVLQSLKEVFLQDGVLSVLINSIMGPLSKLPDRRTDREHGLIRLTLSLLRNLLAVTDSTSTTSTSTTSLETHKLSTTQERLVLQMEKENVLSLLLGFAGSINDTEYKEWNMIVLEIIYFLFARRSAEDLLYQKFDKKEGDETSTTTITNNKPARTRPVNFGSRHSRFGGTLTLQMNDGKTRLAVHNPSAALKGVVDIIDGGKKTGPNRNKKERDTGYIPFEFKESQAVFRDFAEACLENGFNAMVQSVKADFDMERAKVREGDYERFFWFVEFFLGFMWRRCKPQDSLIDLQNVAAIMNYRCFPFVLKKIESYAEEKFTSPQKKKTNTTSHLSSPQYPLLFVQLQTLSLMKQSTDEDILDVANNIENNLYYEDTMLKLVVGLCRKVPTRRTMEVLAETIHVYLKMLEKFASAKSVLFMKKVVKGKSRKKEEDGMGDESDGDEQERQKIREKEYRFEEIEI